MKGGFKMTIEQAIELYRKGYAVTHDADKHKIIIEKDK